MTPATEGDRGWIEARLRAEIATSMFPLGNLARHGWESDAPRGMRFWVDRSRVAVLGLTNEGMLMPQAPDLDFSGVSDSLAGRTIIGAAGEAGQVRALLKTAGLSEVPAKLDADEPRFLLGLDALRVPDGPGELVPLAAIDRALLEAWRADYLKDVAGEDADTAPAAAARDIAGYLEADTHRVLLDAGIPIAMTGFNARLPEIVQIGGVYTPPALRGRGHARRALALHLAEARAEGVREATLFAASEAAVRCYAPLGFRRSGSFVLILFRAPERIDP